MRIKFFLVGFFLVCVSYMTYSQDIGAYAGVSQNSMKDMKSLQEFIASFVPVPYQFTDQFQSYWMYGIYAGLPISKKGKIGLNVNTTSTGARSVYSDFSGKTYQDYLLKCIGISAYYDHQIFAREKIEGSLYALTGINATQFEYEEYFQLGSQSASESLNFESINFMVELGGTMKYFFYKKLFVEGRLGYQINQQSSLKDEAGNEIVISNSNTVSADWSGFKLNFGIGFRF